MCLVPAAVASAGLTALTTEATGAILAAQVAASAAAGASAGAKYDAATYNAEVAQQNAAALDAQANNERAAGSSEAQKNTIETRQSTSRAATQMAANGVNIASGTSVDLLAQNEGIGAMDSMTIIDNANRTAMGLEAEADYMVDAADYQKDSAALGVATTVLAQPAIATQWLGTGSGATQKAVGAI